MAQTGHNPPAMEETQVWSLSGEDALEMELDYRRGRAHRLEEILGLKGVILGMGRRTFLQNFQSVELK